MSESQDFPWIGSQVFLRSRPTTRKANLRNLRNNMVFVTLLGSESELLYCIPLSLNVTSLDFPLAVMDALFENIIEAGSNKNWTSITNIYSMCCC